MKKLILASLVLLSFLSAQAQSDVYLKINHRLGADPFAFNTDTETADGEEVKFRRLEYYISQIALVHDGGQITKVNDTWLLVNAGSSTNVLLGNFAITSLEEIRFAVGIEPTVNHKDPSAYAPSHPLAPKSPSMHWGWEAGYRFVALEGSAGPMRNQNMEIHSLGDVNYKQIKIATAGSTSGSDQTIELNADYQETLAGIVTKDGLIVHAENFEGADLMTNFQTKVFTSSEGNASALFVNAPVALAARLYPNPSANASTLQLENSAAVQAIVVYNQQGQEVLRVTTPAANTPLEVNTPGIYFIQALGTEQNYTLIKWVVTH